MPTPQYPFLETLYHLRTVEHLTLYQKIAELSHEEEQEVLRFLEAEYERESSAYPCDVPAYNAAAALWGAKTTYFAAQLFLYRDNQPAELLGIVPPYPGEADASAMLSADIMLRFLPSVVYNLERTNADDPLIPILHGYLKTFHYSAVGHELELGWDDIKNGFDNNCLRRQYLDRITEVRALNWASIPQVKELLLADMGDYTATYWKELSLL